MTELTDEQKAINSELAKRVGVRTQSLTINDAIAATVNEHGVVDVRYQDDGETGGLWTVKFHATYDCPMTVSYHGDRWEDAFAACFRQADTLRADTLADRNQG